MRVIVSAYMCANVIKVSKGTQFIIKPSPTFLDWKQLSPNLPTQDTLSPLPPPPSWLHSLYLKRILKSFSLLFINLESNSPPHQCKLQKLENLAKQSNKLTWVCTSFSLMLEIYHSHFFFSTWTAHIFN